MDVEDRQGKLLYRALDRHSRDNSRADTCGQERRHQRQQLGDRDNIV